jgi:hypothetical protein
MPRWSRRKGAAQVTRTLRGRSGSRFHVAVDVNAAPLAVRLAAGSENERLHLLPLVDELLGLIAGREATRTGLARVAPI